MNETCLIVDGNSLLYRAFHALPLMDSGGDYTNAVHGFLMMLFRAIEEYTPTYCCIAFDEHAPTFRHLKYADYKAGRAPMPDELRPQFPIIKEVLSAMGMGVLSLPGFEADDLLGTVSEQCRSQGIRALVLTGDRDALQLVKPGISLLFTKKGISELIFFDEEKVQEQYGIPPDRVTDWKGLMGDSSDNIPGVPGVGEKTAVKLLGEYGSLDNVLAHADEIKGKLGEKIRANKEQALFSKELATICNTAPMPFQMQDWALTHLLKAKPVFDQYRLHTAFERLRRLSDAQDSSSPDLPLVAPLVWEDLADENALAAFLQSLAPSPLALLISDDEMTLCQGEHHRGRVVFGNLQQSMFETPDGLSIADALRIVAPALQHGLITHDAKKLFARMGGLPLPPLVWDTMIAAYLLSPQEKTYSLSAFSEDHAEGVMSLCQKQKAELVQGGSLKLYEEIEKPLVRVLFDMETDGFMVDADILAAQRDALSERILKLRQDIFDASGTGEFNINSTQQLGVVLYEQLKLPARKKTTRGYSTDAESLEALAELHPIIPLIQEYRQLSKLLSTYVEPLLRLRDQQGRIHTTFDQTATATGRISSNEPNLQNIPVRTEQGREIRKVFIAKEGCLLVDGDYSQIELRILAHMSGDPAMCEAFVENQDIHTRTAAAISGVPMEAVTGAMRSAAKAVNFGIVYGISDFGLARNIGISRQEASRFIADYFAHYPGVRQFMEDAKKTGYEKGYTQTLYGRRRPLPELLSKNANIRNFGERAAMNTPIQGTAADIIKAAMVKVHKALQDGGFETRLILQVHDELLLEAPLHEAEAAAQLLKTCMEEIITLKVPLVCDVNIGKNWNESK